MTVKTINGLEPDENGNIFLPHGPEGPPGEQGLQGIQGIQGLRGLQGERGDKGEQGIIFTNDPNKQLKMYYGITRVGSNEGRFNLDISQASFNVVLHASPMLIAGNFSAANAPLSLNFDVPTITTISGKAFKATSAGLLAAMQQTSAEPGTEIALMIIGY